MCVYECECVCVSANVCVDKGRRGVESETLICVCIFFCMHLCARRRGDACVGIFRCVAVCCSVLQCVAVCCSVLQCVAVCCSVLQFVKP